MMEGLIEGFPQQIAEAIEIGKKAQLTAPKAAIHNILVTGLGGSGIGGNLVSDLYADYLSVPFQVNKDYDLPAYVNEHTLVIASSYSGNTEETVSAMEKAIARGAKVVCITTGGKVGELATKHSLDQINIPPGLPPRGCLGYSFTQQLFVLNHFGFVPDEFLTQLEAAISLLETERANIKADTLAMAKALKDKLPIIYVPDGLESVGVRLRQQLNENSKMLCWHHVIPEMNHNEIVGWKTTNAQLAPLFLLDKTMLERKQTRIKITDEITARFGENRSITALGNSKMERALYLINWGDWLSLYLAYERDYDPMEIDNINYLKGKLAELG